MFPVEGDRKMAVAMLQMCLGYRGTLVVRSRAASAVSLGLVSSQLRAFSLRKDPDLEENPYYSKYRDKIQQLRRSDPATFEARMERSKEAPRPVMGSSAQAKYVQEMEEKVARQSGKEGFTRNKTLNSLLNIDLVKNKSAEDIAKIWSQYFSEQDTVFAVIPGDVFDLIQSRSRHCPSFLYVLPRAEGYEFFVGQWSGAELHFTSLINIQTVGDSAPSQLILYHYSELRADKGIVLMRAEFDSKHLGVPEAQCLANQVQLFYSGDHYKLVQTFNHNPSNFKYMEVVSALQPFQTTSGTGPVLPLL